MSHLQDCNRYHFMARYHSAWCGLNAINNLFGTYVVRQKDFENEMSRRSLNCNEFLGRSNKGHLSNDMVVHLIRKYSGNNSVQRWRAVGPTGNSVDYTVTTAVGLNTGKYIFYAWNCNPDPAVAEAAHYVAVVDGFIYCDKYSKRRVPRIVLLSEENLECTFYFKFTSIIKVWLVK